MDSVKPYSYTLFEVAKCGDLTPRTQIAVKSLYENLHPSLKYLYPMINSDKYYFHHGVYLGHCEVAHFSGKNKTDAKPRRCDILEFIRGSVGEKLYQVVYDDPTLERSTEETLRDAEKAIENPGCWPVYQIVKNNCESFATWLKTGKKKSAQATAVITKIVDLTFDVATGSSVPPFRASKSCYDVMMDGI